MKLVKGDKRGRREWRSGREQSKRRRRRNSSRLGEMEAFAVAELEAQVGLELVVGEGEQLGEAVNALLREGFPVGGQPPLLQHLPHAQPLQPLRYSLPCHRLLRSCSATHKKCPRRRRREQEHIFANIFIRHREE